MNRWTKVITTDYQGHEDVPLVCEYDPETRFLAVLSPFTSHLFSMVSPRQWTHLQSGAAFYTGWAQLYGYALLETVHRASVVAWKQTHCLGLNKNQQARWDALDPDVQLAKAEMARQIAEHDAEQERKRAEATAGLAADLAAQSEKIPEPLTVEQKRQRQREKLTRNKQQTNSK